MKETETEIENHKLRAEVERLKAVEKVQDEERERSTLWADDLRQRFHLEKQVLEDKVASLEERLASAIPASGTGSSATATSSSSSVSTTAFTAVTSSPAMTVPAVTSSDSSSTAIPSTTVTSTSASTVAMSSGSETSTTDSTTTVMSVGSAEMIKQLFDTQSLMFTAQMQAASLPPLRTFDGQSDGDDKEFDLWLERFEERAKLAKWTDKTKLCQLRLHLSKVAGQAL